MNRSKDTMEDSGYIWREVHMNKKEVYCEEDVWEYGLESYLEEFEDSQKDFFN